MAFRKVSVGWRTKSLAFNIFDRAPFGASLYYLLQHHVTRTVPREMSPTSMWAVNQLKHVRVIRESFAPDAVSTLEIGAGWDLYGNLVNWTMGIERQTIIDVRRLARADAINHIIAGLQRQPLPGAMREPPRAVRGGHLDEDLHSIYGIRYLAPQDGRALPLRDGSVNVILSTSVFEHIPAEVIPPIIAEFRRVLRDDGVMSHIIDYSDHYAHADPAIGNFNYCTMSDAEWARHNPGIHYQNRLRHADFARFFAAGGFRPVNESSWSEPVEKVRSLPLDERFKKYPLEELAIIGTHFVFRKR